MAVAAEKLDSIWFEKEKWVMTHFRNLDKHSTVWPKQVFYFHSRLHHSWRFGGNWLETERFQWGLILSCIHFVAIYTSPLTAEQSWVAYIADVTEKCPMQAGLRGCGQFTSCELSQATKVYCAQSQPLNPKEAIKPFHLLCMSFLAVLLLEEARHWSHLTGTSVELFQLNYS